MDHADNIVGAGDNSMLGVIGASRSASASSSLNCMSGDCISSG